jgi:DNA-binding IclR family transcriptional regulator
MSTPDVYDHIDAISVYLTDEPQTPSALARKARITTGQAHRALRFMVSEHYAVREGNGAWARYRERRAGEVTW